MEYGVINKYTVNWKTFKLCGTKHLNIMVFFDNKESYFDFLKYKSNFMLINRTYKDKRLEEELLKLHEDKICIVNSGYKFSDYGITVYMETKNIDNIFKENADLILKWEVLTKKQEIEYKISACKTNMELIENQINWYIKEKEKKLKELEELYNELNKLE